MVVARMQVYTEVSSLIELCRVPLKVVQLTSSMPAPDWVCSTPFSNYMKCKCAQARAHASGDFIFLLTLSYSQYCLQRTALAALPEILVTTPACVKKCLSDGVLQPTSIDESLEILVLDEVREHLVTNRRTNIFVSFG